MSAATRPESEQFRKEFSRVFLPFFDQTSSARYIADLLADAEPAFKSIALIGPRSSDLAKDLSNLRPDLAINLGDATSDVALSFDAVHLKSKADRVEHVKRVSSFATRESIIACPLGTELQAMIYSSLVRLATERELMVPLELAQALKFGLPTPTDAAEWAHGATDLDFFYAGDVSFFREQATQYLRTAGLSPIKKTLLKFTDTYAPTESEVPLPPETVPMKRHRRLFLILRKR